MGFRDGGEDIERFKRAAFDGKVKARPSLLLRSAFADAVCLRDPANNAKLAKARSTGRIDAAAASVLAVAEGVSKDAPRRPAMAEILRTVAAVVEAVDWQKPPLGKPRIDEIAEQIRRLELAIEKLEEIVAKLKKARAGLDPPVKSSIIYTGETKPAGARRSDSRSFKYTVRKPACFIFKVTQ